MKRRTLDQLMPDARTRLRVFFPHGAQARELVARGQTRYSSDARCDLEHLLGDASGDEWVPGWYVAQRTGIGPRTSV